MSQHHFEWIGPIENFNCLWVFSWCLWYKIPILIGHLPYKIFDKVHLLFCICLWEFELCLGMIKENSSHLYRRKSFDFQTIELKETGLLSGVRYYDALTIQLKHSNLPTQ